MYPQSLIYFGVLHGLALTLIVYRFTPHFKRWLWPLGALAIATPFIAAYDHSYWPGIDFMNEKTPWPQTSIG